MKDCSWYLWLGGRKIYNIRQLRENFDTALLIGYYLGGSLMKWLSDSGEYSILKRLDSIDKSRDIGKQLEFAFGVSPDVNRGAPILPPSLPVPVDTPEIKNAPVYVSSFALAAGFSFPLPDSFNGLVSGSFTGMNASSFSALVGSSFTGLEVSSFMSLIAGSFSGLSESSFISLFTSSYSGLLESSFSSLFGNIFSNKYISSFYFGSYSSFLSGQALFAVSSYFTGSFGSFYSFLSRFMSGYGGSFSLSSFNLSSFNLFFGKYGQFTLGSFGGSFAGSFMAWLFMLMKMMNSGSFGSFGSFGNIDTFFGSGSFRYNAAGFSITAEEYHRTLINLSSCPLNAYGYGINLI